VKFVTKLLVIFFGITNSLAIFQMIMNNIFWDLIVEGIVVRVKANSSDFATRAVLLQLSPMDRK